MITKINCLKDNFDSIEGDVIKLFCLDLNKQCKIGIEKVDSKHFKSTSMTYDKMIKATLILYFNGEYVKIIKHRNLINTYVDFDKIQNEKGKVNLDECKPGDILISSLGSVLYYVSPTNETQYLDHVVRYSDGSEGTRTNDGYVFKNKRIAETDHDIIGIIKKSEK